MSNKQNHIRQLLKRWISGDITAADEQRLDTAAKGDQFLGEALGGLRATTEENHEQNIAHLRKQLNNDKKKKGFVYMPILRIAAALALLIVAAWFVWTGPALNSSADMAMKTAEPEMQAPIQNTINTKKAIETDPIPTKNDLPGSITQKRSKTSPRNRSTTPIAQSEPVPTDFSVSGEAKPTIFKDKVEEITLPATTTDQSKVTLQAQALKNQLDETPTATESGIAVNDISPPSSAFIITEESKNNGQVLTKEDSFMRHILPDKRIMISNMGYAIAREGFRVINGFITDSEGYPLIGASILEVGTENGTVSDIDGFFTIAVADQKNVQLKCNYLGYETTFIALNEQENYQIILNEDTTDALNEVVVTALGIEKSSKSTAYSQSTVGKENESSNKQAAGQPVLGFNALKNYIRQNTPNDVGRGKIRLRFTINASGRPTNIRVLHSTNHSLDALAIQLISSGPNWLITNGEAPVEVEYRVRIK